MRTVVTLALSAAFLLSAPIAAALTQPSIEVEVTGDPAPGLFVARAVERAIRWTAAGDDLAVDFISPPTDLSSGGDTVVLARVRRGAPASETIVSVQVRNTESGCQRARLLFVSNSPETLRFATGLFRGSLATGETVRLVYHHRNGTSGAMALLVQVANPSRMVARLWVNDTGAPPVRDEITAGHVAGGRWLTQYWTCTAQRVDVAPNSTLRLDTVALADGQVGSGVVQAWLERGERAVLDVQARMGPIDPAQASYLINRDTTHSRGTFPSPERELRIDHNAGEVSLLSIGQTDHAADATTGRPLRGNYGVIYNVRGALTNTDRQLRKVVIRAVAAGGPARGTFLINGQVYATGYLRQGMPAIVATITVAPSTRIPFFLSTMPQSGSAYPLRLVLGPP